DDPARQPLERVLAAELSGTAFAKLAAALGKEPSVESLRELARFLARAGLPELLDGAELAASPTRANLVAALARDPAGAFAHVPPPSLSWNVAEEFKTVRAELNDELRPTHPDPN